MIRRGDVLDGMYQIVKEIGQGGMGIIYLAEHLRLQKKVVVKKVKDHFVGQINGRAEVDILKNLHHSYLPQVYDFFVLDNSVYTVMEYIEGNDLQYYINQRYRFSEDVLRKWLLQLTEVLEYLHAQTPPILHSDIKPANIMITYQGNVCLIDFNISIDGEDSKDVQGISPWFAAPEQYAKVHAMLYGESDTITLDGRMDVYSLGATFYTVMTGMLPTPEREINVGKMNIDYSDGFCSVITRAMRQNMTHRFRSAKQMKRALQDVSRMDPLYRKYEYVQIVGVFIWVLCVALGCICLYYGSWRLQEEAWQEDHRDLFRAVEEQNETEIVAKATEMLNQPEYGGYLEKETEKRAEVLHVLGESYFRREEYDEAARCYRDAWELRRDDDNYCLDYVIAAVRGGQTAAAEKVLASREGKALIPEGVRCLVRAEIARMNGNDTQAVEQLERLMDYRSEVDTRNLLNGYCLLAVIYEERGEYEQAVAALKQAEEFCGFQETRNVLRQMGRVAFQGASESRETTKRQGYLRIALECYESLNQKWIPTYEDQMNLALTERESGDYEGSNRILKVLEGEYGSVYEIPMWLCRNYLDIAKKQKGYDEVAGDLKKYYRRAKKLYEDDGKKDEGMEELVEVMETLMEKLEG